MPEPKKRAAKRTDAQRAAENKYSNGDTTTYITRKFTTGQEQTLGDVLETLPGFKVDKENSTVEANGKPVTRILISGQQLRSAE